MEFKYKDITVYYEEVDCVKQGKSHVIIDIKYPAGNLTGYGDGTYRFIKYCLKNKLNVGVFR